MTEHTMHPADKHARVGQVTVWLWRCDACGFEAYASTKTGAPSCRERDRRAAASLGLGGDTKLC